MKNAYVLINCNLGKEEDILATLRSIKSVKEAHEIFGAHNNIVEMSSENPDTLREDITWKIHRLFDVSSILTLMETGQNQEE